MKMQIFCVRDRATDQYGNPMFLVADGQAIRSFADEVNRDAGDNLMFKHPDDFDLYKLGSYDTDSGLFECFTPTMVITGKMARIPTNGKG